MPPRPGHMTLAGYFYDPKHGGCLRRVRVRGSRVTVRGVYGADEAAPGAPWTTTGVVERRLPDGTWEVRFDFRAKADRARDAYVARWRPARRALEWDDGNCWRQMHFHATQLM